MSSTSKQTLQLREIIDIATRLRSTKPAMFGIKGAAKGSPGYVPDGWKNAIKAAVRMYYAKTGKHPSAATERRKQLGTIASRLKDDPRKDALYRGYKQALETLKAKYWNAGLKIRAVQPAQPKKDRSGVPRQRKRLPPVILPYSGSLKKRVQPKVRFEQSSNLPSQPVFAPKRLPALPRPTFVPEELPSPFVSDSNIMEEEKERKRKGPSLIKPIFSGETRPTRILKGKRRKEAGGLSPEDLEVLQELEAITREMEEENEGNEEMGEEEE